MSNRYLIFNKPFHVLTQFTDDQGRKTLKDFIDIPEVYSAGRLDFDSEGLLILTNDGQMVHSMMDPKHKVSKTYLAQVEGLPSAESLVQLRKGLELKDGKTRPCKAEIIEEPHWLWARNPPIRERKNIPTQWLRLTLTEGKNRQVRRMTAAINHPTLRLVRESIGNVLVKNLENGAYLEVDLDFLKDNGINYKSKKSSTQAAFSKKGSFKRSGPRPPRNQRRPHRSRKA